MGQGNSSVPSWSSYSWLSWSQLFLACLGKKDTESGKGGVGLIYVAEWEFISPCAHHSLNLQCTSAGRNSSVCCCKLYTCIYLGHPWWSSSRLKKRYRWVYRLFFNWKGGKAKVENVVSWWRLSGVIYTGVLMVWIFVGFFFFLLNAELPIAFSEPAQPAQPAPSATPPVWLLPMINGISCLRGELSLVFRVLGW